MLSGSGLDLAHGALQRDRVSYFERGINNVSLTNEKLNPQELKLNLFPRFSTLKGFAETTLLGLV